MQTYKAIAAVGINPGAVVKLTDEQATARVHAITAQGKNGTYLVRSRIEFKGGENPYEGNKNSLTDRQVNKQRRLMSHHKKAEKKRRDKR